jgi:hypothetical protein
MRHEWRVSLPTVLVTGMSIRSSHDRFEQL